MLLSIIDKAAGRNQAYVKEARNNAPHAHLLHASPEGEPPPAEPSWHRLCISCRYTCPARAQHARIGPVPRLPALPSRPQVDALHQKHVDTAKEILSGPLLDGFLKELNDDITSLKSLLAAICIGAS